MQKLNDLSRSLTALEPEGTLIAVIEMTTVSPAHTSNDGDTSSRSARADIRHARWVGAK